MRSALLAVAFMAVAPATADAANCTVSATGVAFGTYIPTATGPTGSTGTVTVTCSATSEVVQYSIALDVGQNSGGSFSNRRLQNGTSSLSYQIYTDATRTTVWGDGTGGTSTVSDSYSCASCTNQSRSYTTYGRLPGQQFSASPGPHTDTITVIVTFN
jgi:spore coat protein U-like protein